jgi:UDP-2,4-diacetamido-2,4,6-trideoxy-beta-L-altropyranose hydrolase
LPRNPGTLLLRSDASTAMGTGHVMRCFALAQAWQDAGGQAAFAMADGSPAIRQRLCAENMEVMPLQTSAGTEDDAKKVAELASRCAAAWVTVDGYQFGSAYQRQLKADGVKLLFLDDYGHAAPYSADLVLNQNVHAQKSFYADREVYTRLLLGPRYAMLRREFERWRNWEREIAQVGRKVLVTMGGSDPDNVSARVIEASGMVPVEGLEVAVVVGGSNPHSESLERLAVRCGGRVRLRSDVSNMSELMAWADVAVSAAGTTCWEMCLLGLPAILIDLAENQRPIAQDLDRKGCAVYFGSSSDVDSARMAAKLEWMLLSPDVRDACSHRASRLVDGYGAKRIVDVLKPGESNAYRMSL